MNRLAIAAVVAALCTSAFAQSYTYSPHPSFQSDEGGLYAYYFGRYVTQRHQLLDANFTSQLLVIKGIQFRADGRSHTTSTGMGRSWSNVNLDVGPTTFDYTTSTTTFTNNFSATPTNVFSGSVAWPSLSGNTPSPGTWSYDFSFSQAWIKATGENINCDFSFTGGTFANNSTTTGINYYLDGYSYGSTASGTTTYHGKYSSTGGCADSKAYNTYGAYCYPYFYLYGPTYSTTSWRNTMRSYIYGVYLPPERSIFAMLGFKVNTAGNPFPGVTCNNFHVDMTLPTILFPVRTNSTSSSSGGNFYLHLTGQKVYPNLAPFNSSFSGTELVSQCAWTDTGDSSMKISAAGSTIIPSLPLFGTYADSKLSSVYNLSSTTSATGTKSEIYYYNPIRRYVQ